MKVLLGFLAILVSFFNIVPIAHAAIIRNFNGDTVYNIRIDGAVAGHSLGRYITFVADFNNNGKSDVLVGTPHGGYNGTNSGSIWIIYDDILDNYTGKGNTLDLNDSTKYSLRIDGPTANSYIGYDGAISARDLNNDGLTDLAFSTPYTGFNSRASSGSIYVIYNSLLSSHQGTGNNMSLADSNDYHVRFDGATAGDITSDGLVEIGDVNSDGEQDLLFGAYAASYNGRSGSGSAYVIYSSLLETFTGTGNNVDLADDSNFNLRFDGAGDNDLLTYAGAEIIDMNADGSNDLVIPAGYSSQGGVSFSGSVYVIYSTTYTSYTGTGNLIDLADGSSYNIRFDGTSNTENLGLVGTAAGDINNNGRNDLVLAAFQADNSSKADSGSVYLINDSILSGYSGTGNEASLGDGDNYTVRFDGAGAGDRLGLWPKVGNIDNEDNLDIAVTAYNATNNGVNRSGSIYIFGNSVLQQFSGTGNVADLSVSEYYSMRFDGKGDTDLLGSGGYDFGDINNDGIPDLMLPARLADNNSRTDSGSVYLVYGEATLPATPSSPPKLMPEIKAFSSGISGANGVLSIVDAGTLPWDAYFSVDKKPKLGAKRITGLYWQVSPALEIWWKSHFNDARIVSPLKPYILSLSYDPNEIEPVLQERKLKLAISEDDGTTWKIVDNSWVDQVNHTVNATTQRGGLFVLVSRY